MFEGRAREAMRFYAASFADAEIERIEHYQADEAGTEGLVKRATLRLGAAAPVHRQPDRASVYVHAGGLPVRLFVDCVTAADLDELIARLSDGGAVLMALAEYPFSRRFGWLTDRFGVSWQLNLA
jgi:predicted 3-demethylubiquinone-9 3-methyltransferase (glyoxalase superfamily)